MTAAGIEIIVIDINPTTTLYRFVGSIRSKLSEKENSSATGNATKIKLFIWRVITLSIDWMLDDSKSLATRLVILQETIRSVKTPGKIEAVVGRIRTDGSSPAKK